jgi:hypothetical protein
LTATGLGQRRCWPRSRGCGPCHGLPAADHRHRPTLACWAHRGTSPARRRLPSRHAIWPPAQRLMPGPASGAALTASLVPAS